MWKHDPSSLTERDLPEWLQREVAEIRRQEARDRLKVAAFALIFPAGFVLAVCTVLNVTS